MIKRPRTLPEISYRSVSLAVLVALGALLADRPAQAADLPGRYSMATAPGVVGSPPLTVMVDTATGQSWVLVQTPGPPLHWAPVRFWTPGTPPELVPLPPAPATIGGSATPLSPTRPR